MRDTRGAQLKYFKHMKIYVGLLESSAMFLMGLFVFFSRPQIGHLYLFDDVELKVPHGKCKIVSKLAIFLKRDKSCPFSKSLVHHSLYQI